MVFADHLRNIGDAFRKRHLDSDDKRDGTSKPSSWLHQNRHTNVHGGPFMAVHWRRGDFPESASPVTAARQVKQAFERASISPLPIFIATDAEDEGEELCNLNFCWHFHAALEGNP